MEVQLTVSGADTVDQVASLFSWLTDEPGLRGRVRIVEPVRAEDDLGALSDTLMVLLGSGGVGAALASALRAWLQRRSVDVTITLKSKEKSIQVRADRAKDAESTLRQLRQFLDEADGE
ncbi:effector-associated constant component EACC1 [Kribbella sancticallisti]